MAFFDAPKNETKANYFSPMQDELDQLAKNIYRQIQSDEKSFDPHIFAKYKVKKYVKINSKGKRVEAWVFDDKSTLVPIIEDHLIKRAQSLFAAASHIFAEQKIALDQLRQMEEAFINHIYLLPNLTAKKAKELTENLINDITHFWSQSSKDISMSPQKFMQRLFLEAEVPPFADYRMSDVFVLNRDPNVRSVQYFERGTRPVVLPRDEKLPPLDFYSSHYRSNEGISNFVASGKGFIENDGTPSITDISFRHSSLAPIDLYKKKTSTMDTILLTTHNIEHLANEALSRSERKEPLHLMNISLMTVNSQDKQDRQFNETILAADRLRFRDRKDFIPITHSFGVNWFAKGGKRTRSYPAEQQFENQRAFFQTQELFFNAIKKATGVDELKNLIASYEAKTQELRNQFKNEIEEKIRPLAQAYDLAMQAYERAENKTDELKKAVTDSMKQLIETKKSLHAKANVIMSHFKNVSVSMIKDMRDMLLKQASHIDPQQLKQISSAIFAVEDYCNYQELFVNDQWSAEKELYKIQAHLHSLGNNLSRLGTAVAMTKNCKSGNDRTFTADVRDDQIRLERQFGLLKNSLRLSHQYGQGDVNYQSHYAGGAWTFVTPIDSDGGASKPSKYGNPFLEFCMLQNELSGLAGHKFSKKYKKAHAVKKPKLLLSEAKHEMKIEATLDNQLSMLIQQLAALQLALKEKEKTVSIFKTCTSAVEIFSTFLIAKIAPMVASKNFNRRLLLDADEIQTFKNLMDGARSSIISEEKDSLNPDKIQTDILANYTAMCHEAIVGPARQSQAAWIAGIEKNLPNVAHEIKSAMTTIQTKGWKEAIKRSAKNATGVGDFFKRAFHKDSGLTKKVNEAQKAFFEKRAPDSIGQLEQLTTLQNAIDAWLNKHRGSQFTADGKLRPESRLPAMLALREISILEMEKITKPAASAEIRSAAPGFSAQ